MSERGAVDLNEAVLLPRAASYLCVRWSADLGDLARDDDQVQVSGGWRVDWFAQWRADWQAAAVQLVVAHGGQPTTDAPGTVRASFEHSPGAALADHALRSVHCGQALLATAREHDALARPHGSAGSLTPRVGVHSLAVAHADGPDVAACIADAAPAGRLGLSHATAALVRAAFDIEPIVPLACQPAQGSVQMGLLGGSRRVDGPRMADAGRSTAGDVGLIGREAELLALQQAHARLIARPQASRLMVVAVAGFGKTRLMAAFDAWARVQPQPVHTLRARAGPQTRTRPFGLLRDMFFGHCRIDESDPPQRARQRLEQAIAPWFAADEGAAVAEGHAHSLAHLFGIDAADSPHIGGILGDARQIHQRAVHAARHWLRRLSAAGRSPVLMLLDDLQWADDETLDFLDGLLEANADTALLLLASSRPELAQRRAPWFEEAAGRQLITLPALSATAGRKLVQTLLAKLPALPSGLVDGLTAGAGGHPQFIEERLQLLIDSGVVSPGVDSWSVDIERLHRTRLPTTLSGVLKARLALLPPESHQALQAASVIGPSFSVAALQALGQQLTQALPMLLDRAWAAPVPDATDLFTFKHASMQQAAYASLPVLNRRDLHGTVARWLVAAAVLGRHTAPAATAQHFEQAGEDLLAAEHHVRAAQHAAALFAPEAALRHAQRGLDILERLPATAQLLELRWQLLRRRVSALEILGRDAQYEVDIVALGALADQLDEATKRTEATAIRCGQLLLSEDYVALKATARQYMALADAAGMEDYRVDAMRLLADARCGLGDWDGGVRLARQALEQARALAVHSTAANCLNTLAAVAERQQDPLGRIHCHEQAMALSRQIGDRRGEATQLVNLAGAWLSLGELAAAGQAAGQALSLARSLGARLHESLALSHSATLALWLGQTQQALDLVKASVDAAGAAGAPIWQADARLVLGNVALALGDNALAQQAFEQALESTQEAKGPRWLDAIAGLARVALLRADLPAALQLVEQVLDLEAATQSHHDAGSPRSLDLVMYRVLASAGEGRAMSWLQRAHGQLMVTTASIADPTLREGFLNNIPDHRAILAAWALAQEQRVREPTQRAP